MCWTFVRIIYIRRWVSKIDYIHMVFSPMRCISKIISLDNLARRQNSLRLFLHFYVMSSLSQHMFGVNLRAVRRFTFKWMGQLYCNHWIIVITTVMSCITEIYIFGSCWHMEVKTFTHQLLVSHITRYKIFHA